MILLGFAGILLILKPGLGLFQPAALIGVLSALFASVAQVGIRRLTRTEPVERIVFYFGVISTAVSAAPLVREWRTPPATLWVVLAGLGIVATLGQLALTRAYSHAPATRVGPFIYSAVVFAALLDWLFWGQLAGPAVAGGGAARGHGRRAGPARAPRAAGRGRGFLTVD